MPSYKILKSWVKRDSMISKEGYILIKIPEHPKSFRGWYYEHRLVIEKNLDRILEVWETIHHINENKTDNRIENLFLCTREQHNKAHK
jgi:HNH endonuclease